eukprot:SAG31_NODE_2000_length_6694_cov_13.828658_5_plen_148_part_00
MDGRANALCWRQLDGMRGDFCFRKRCGSVDVSCLLLGQGWDDRDGLDVEDERPLDTFGPITQKSFRIPSFTHNRKWQGFADHIERPLIFESPEAEGQTDSAPVSQQVCWYPSGSLVAHSPVKSATHAVTCFSLTTRTGARPDRVGGS